MSLASESPNIYTGVSTLCMYMRNAELYAVQMWPVGSPFTKKSCDGAVRAKPDNMPSHDWAACFKKCN